MSTTIRPAQAADVERIVLLVNRFAANNIMLPRTQESIRDSLEDWLVAVDEDEAAQPVVGCGALVALSDTLAEVRSLAVAENQHGQGLGSRLVTALIDLARAQGFPQICALTLREDFFIRLGFELVDRWSISPKVWQECIYCPKFHACDEVAVLMNLAEQPIPVDNGVGMQQRIQAGGWNALLKWGEWQPLRLAYQERPAKIDRGLGGFG